VFVFPDRLQTIVLLISLCDSNFGTAVGGSESQLPPTLAETFSFRRVANKGPRHDDRAIGPTIKTARWHRTSASDASKIFPPQ
jgi:hypothetical protein